MFNFIKDNNFAVNVTITKQTLFTVSTLKYIKDCNYFLSSSSHFFSFHIIQKSLKHRRVKHFGYEFHYENNNVDKNKPLLGGK